MDEEISSGMPKSSSWEELSRGEALQIMAISDDNSQITLNEENLKTVISELSATGVEAVSVISVVGAFRAGKSFLLDVFLRYLRNTSGDEDAFPEDPNGTPEWLTCGGTQPRLTEGAGEPGFSWRSGRERTTTGLWMFSKPFVRVNATTGECTNVLLMDTQGMFDMQTPPALTAAIFGLSTLISSYQIYNIPRQIQEDTLQQLHFFTEFSLCALREYRASRSASSPSASEDGGRPFQQLDFLVRDWAHFDENWSLNRCIEEMDHVLEDSLVVNVRDAGTREQIRAMFDKISCFLLPHPGTDMTKPNYDGDLSIVEPGFIKLLSVYCHHVLDEGIHAKKVQGQLVSATMLGHYIRAFAKCFIDGQVPEALTLVEAMSSTTNLCAREKATKQYRAKMEESCGPSKEFVEDAALEAPHQAAHTEAMTLFDSLATFGKEEDRAAARKELDESIAEAKKQMLRENAMKMDQSLVRYAPAVLILVAAFVSDKLSDFVCDWWSDTCVQISWLLLFTYLGLIAFILYVAYELHQRRGTVAAVNGMLALGQASTRMSVEYGEIVKSKGLDAYSQLAGSAEAPAQEDTKLKSQ